MTSSAPKVLEGVLDRLQRIGISDLPLGPDAGCMQHAERGVETLLGHGPTMVDVRRPVPHVGAERGRNDEDVGVVPTCSVADLVAERLAGDGLIGDNENPAAPSRTRLPLPDRRLLGLRLAPEIDPDPNTDSKSEEDAERNPASAHPAGKSDCEREQPDDDDEAERLGFTPDGISQPLSLREKA